MPSMTSESVTPGHPDKVCDQISDAILDLYLSRDPGARVAVETMATAYGVVLAGEVRSNADVEAHDRERVAREVLYQIGYRSGSDYPNSSVRVLDLTTAQSGEIADGVDGGDRLGAGDQGMMFGYATDETPERMPTALVAARAITGALTQHKKEIPGFLLPDGKAQVTVDYAQPGNPVTDVVVSAQHTPHVSLAEVRERLRRLVDRTLESAGISVAEDVRMFLNPAGAWTFGGSAADAGLTGRKIIVDGYGGAARVGGGAFSGKDPSKVDRSAAYAARHAARWLVDNGHARRAEVQLSYAIGVPEPVAVSVETFGTSIASGDKLGQHLQEVMDFTPQGIIDRFELQRPIYLDTARNGHFGRDTLPWENCRV